jgi:Transmembrane secretion effector
MTSDTKSASGRPFRARRSASPDLAGDPCSPRGAFGWKVMKQAGMPRCGHRRSRKGRTPRQASAIRNGVWCARGVSGSTLSVILGLWVPCCGDVRSERRPAAGGALRQCHSHRCSTRRNNPHLQATLIRAAALFLFASAYWALLPLVAAHSDRRGQDLYGYLLGAISAAAEGAALGLPRLNRKQDSDPIVLWQSERSAQPPWR